MELVLETLLEKRAYLEFAIEKYKHIPEVVERVQEDIKNFSQVIDIIELHLKIKKQ
jgi:ABC-type long-subunit fatty acid transport system fused permease/ATPase subunit